jgi:transposase
MPKPLVTDELWAFVEPLLPEEPPKPKGGRPRVDDRAALTGILFVLKTGIPWGMLPQEMGCGSGMTCWRRLRGWHEAGVWERLHEAPLDRLGEADRLDWERASLDSAAVPARGGGRKDRPEPDGSRQTGLEAPPCGRPRGRPARGEAIGGQRPRLEDARGGRGRDPADPRAAAGQAWPPAQAPEEALHADKAHDSSRCRKALSKRGIKSRIARRGVGSSERLGRHRWLVERTLSWLNRYRRPKVRYERRDVTSTRRSSTWAAPWSAGATCNGFVRRTK